MNAPVFVSIIMPVFNSGQFVSDAILSVQSQTYENWELIIIDDYSSDNSFQIIQSFASKDPRIHFQQSNSNKGMAAARNVALRIAKGDLIAFLDSDDIWLPKKLETQVRLMESMKVDFSFTSYTYVSERQSKLGEPVKVDRKVCYKDLLRKTQIATSTVIVRRNIIRNFFFDEKLHRVEDYHFWLSILKKGQVAYGINNGLTFYRVASNSFNSSKPIKSAQAVWYILREKEGIPFFRRSFYFINYAFNALWKRLKYGFFKVYFNAPGQ